MLTELAQVSAISSDRGTSRDVLATARAVDQKRVGLRDRKGRNAVVPRTLSTQWRKCNAAARLAEIFDAEIMSMLKTSRGLRVIAIFGAIPMYPRAPGGPWNAVSAHGGRLWRGMEVIFHQAHEARGVNDFNDLADYRRFIDEIVSRKNARQANVSRPNARRSSCCLVGGPVIMRRRSSPSSLQAAAPSASATWRTSPRLRRRPANVSAVIGLARFSRRKIISHRLASYYDPVRAIL
jgi:hypothetical protein